MSDINQHVNLDLVIQTGQEHYRAGFLLEAEMIFRQVLVVDPANLIALDLLGCIANRAGKGELAVNFFRLAIQNNPNNPSTHFNLGVSLQKLTRWDEAVACYRSVLLLKSDHAKAHGNLGVVLHKLGQLNEALSCYLKALELSPHYADVHNNLGNLFFEQGQLHEALACYHIALSLNPSHTEARKNIMNTLQELGSLYVTQIHDFQDLALIPLHAEAYNKLGNAYARLDKWNASLENFNKSLALNPYHTETYNNLGNVLRSLRRYKEALSSYDQALSLKPDYVIAYTNRGNVLQDLKRYEEALSSYDQAISLHPGYADAYNSRGTILEDLKRYEEALTSLDHAISLNSDYAGAYNNRGNVLRNLGRYEEALTSYNLTISVQPNYAGVYSNRGNILQNLGRHEEALANYDRALFLHPDYAGAYNNKASSLQNLARYDDALENFDKALSINPAYADAYYNRGLLLNLLTRYQDALENFDQTIAQDPYYSYAQGACLFAQMHLGSWNDFERRIQDIILYLEQDIPASEPFPLLAVPVAPKVLQKCAMLYMADRYPPARHTLWNGERYDHDRIRLAYFSADFHRHATAYLIAELLEKHDRSRFEVFAFSFGPDHQDDMRTRLVKACDQFFDVSKYSDPAIAALARRLEIDIAVDLKGYTQHCRPWIFAQRPAPVQVNYLGFPGTMGAPYIDYIVADPVVIPPGHFDAYSEKVVHLPYSYQVNDTQRRIAETVPSRVQVGLPATGMVFCCFNNNFKITPDVFTLWMRLLARVDGSVLWLLEGNADIRHHLGREAQRRGVSPERLVFAARMDLPEHLARHQAADLFLDTFYCNAHTTASDALWAGLPVLTCVGDSFAGRVAASLLQAVGLPELITLSHAEYEALAFELATHPDALVALKHKLARQRLTHPLFNSELYTQHIESAYLEMWQRSEQGLPPDHLFITP